MLSWSSRYELKFVKYPMHYLQPCVVGASNIYLGLKTGFTFGPQVRQSRAHFLHQLLTLHDFLALWCMFEHHFISAITN